MEASALLTEWLRSITAITIGTGSTLSSTADENVSVFPVQEAQTAGTTVSELADFIVKAFRMYALQAARSGLRGWFYAWYDEMSGTLRCSVADVRVPKDLPFSCKLEIHDDPRAIAEVALASHYASGIPGSELKEVECFDNADDVVAFVLAVYARSLTTSA